MSCCDNVCFEDRCDIRIVNNLEIAEGVLQINVIYILKPRLVASRSVVGYWEDFYHNCYTEIRVHDY